MSSDVIFLLANLNAVTCEKCKKGDTFGGIKWRMQGYSIYYGPAVRIARRTPGESYWWSYNNNYQAVFFKCKHTSWPDVSDPSWSCRSSSSENQENFGTDLFWKRNWKDATDNRPEVPCTVYTGRKRIFYAWLLLPEAEKIWEEIGQWCKIKCISI